MKKESKPEVLNEKEEGVTSKILWRSPINNDFEKFLLLYKEDKTKARIVFFHSSDDFGGEYARYNPSRGYAFQQLVLFEKESGDFSVIMFRNKWGLSITSKMYKSQRTEAVISFKKTGSKFWLIARKKGARTLLPLTLNNLQAAFGERAQMVMDELQNKFGWMRYLRENRFMNDVAFNTIVRKKLFSLEAAMRHVYKVPYPVAQKLHAAANKNALNTLGHKKFDPFLRYILNIENISDEQVKNTLFWDTVRMGMVLDRKVNCSWGDARLKREHDDWASEITETLLDVKNRDLRLGEIYGEFEKFSGYELLKTTREMVKEGMVNRHCVASYISKVDQGLCGIFRIEGHTLEVVKERKDTAFYTLRMLQFQGFKNEPAPNELRERVLDVIARFNTKCQQDHEEEQKQFAKNGMFGGMKVTEGGVVDRVHNRQIEERPMMLADDLFRDEDLPF